MSPSIVECLIFVCVIQAQNDDVASKLAKQIEE